MPNNIQNDITSRYKLFKNLKKMFPNIDYNRYYESGINSRSRFLRTVQDRFQSASKNVSLLVLSPEELDFVMTLKEINSNITGQSIKSQMFTEIDIYKNFFSNKLAEIGLDINKISSLQDVHFLAEIHQSLQFMNNNAYAVSLPYGVTKINDTINIEKALSIVIMYNPSVLDTGIFTDIKNSANHLKRLGLTPEHIYKGILYHELGHAVIESNAMSGFHTHLTNDTILNNLNRYKTEVEADVHSVVQMATEMGNTNWAEYLMMARGIYLNDSSLSFKRTYNEIYELIMASLQQEYGSSGFDQELINDAMKTHEQLQMADLGEHLSYFTMPSIDYAKNLMDKMLADGSIYEMTDKEKVELSEKIAEETMFEKNQLIKMFHALICGDTENDLFTELNKYAVDAKEYFNITKDYTKKQLEEIQKAKEDTLRSLGFDIGNGFEEDEKDIKKTNYTSHTKSSLELSFKYNHFLAKTNPKFEEISNNDEFSKEEKFIRNALLSIEEGHKEIAAVHQEYANQPYPGYNNILKLSSYIGTIKSEMIDNAITTAILTPRMLDYEKRYLTPDTNTYAGSLNELVAEFVKTESEMLEYSNEHIGDKRKPVFILSLADKEENIENMKKNFTDIAKFERKQIRLANQILEDETFKETYKNHTQLMAHINSVKNYNGYGFTISTVEYMLMKSILPKEIIKGHKTVFRNMMKQRDCGLFIAQNLPAGKPREEFLNAIKTFNGHSVIKNIKKQLVDNTLQHTKV